MEEAQQQREVGDRHRAREESRLKAALAALQVQAAGDAEQLQAARHALKELLPDSQAPAAHSPGLARSGQAEREVSETQARLGMASNRGQPQQASRAQQAWEAHQARQAQQAEHARQAQIARQVQHAQQAQTAQLAQTARQAQQAQQAQHAQQVKHAQRAQHAQQAQYGQRIQQAQPAGQAEQWLQSGQHMWHASQTEASSSRCIPASACALSPASSALQQKHVKSSVAKAAEQHLPAAMQSACLIEAGIVRNGMSFSLPRSSPLLLPGKQPAQQAPVLPAQTAVARSLDPLMTTPSLASSAGTAGVAGLAGLASTAGTAGRASAAPNLAQFHPSSPQAASVQARRLSHPAQPEAAGHAHKKSPAGQRGTAQQLQQQAWSAPSFYRTAARPSTALPSIVSQATYMPQPAASGQWPVCSRPQMLTTQLGSGTSSGQGVRHSAAQLREQTAAPLAAAAAAAATQGAAFNPLLCNPLAPISYRALLSSTSALSSRSPCHADSGPNAFNCMAQLGPTSAGLNMQTPATIGHGQLPLNASRVQAHPAGAYQPVMLQKPLRRALCQPQAATEATARRLCTLVQPALEGLTGSLGHASQGPGMGHSGNKTESMQQSGTSSGLLLMGSKLAEHTDRSHAAEPAPSAPVAGASTKESVQLTLY